MRQLSSATQSCIGRAVWHSDISEPQAWLELEVDNLRDATVRLESRKPPDTLPVPARTSASNGQSLSITGRTAGYRDVHPSDAGGELRSRAWAIHRTQEKLRWLESTRAQMH